MSPRWPSFSLLGAARCGLGLLAGLAFLTLVLGLRSNGGLAGVREREPGKSAPTPLALDGPDLAGVAQRITPFRADGQPPRERYGEQPVAIVQPVTQPRPPKPQLALTGLLWGTEPLAIVEGIPGQEMALVLRRGEGAGGLVIKTIERSAVVIEGMDTTWRLSLREPWH